MDKEHNSFLWNQFAQLGEMIGDGLHYEDPSISKQYKRLSRMLMPEEHKHMRQLKNAKIDEAVEGRLKDDRCFKCSGKLSQVRSGSFVVKCQDCKCKYTYKKK